MACAISKWTSELLSLTAWPVSHSTKQPADWPPKKVLLNKCTLHPEQSEILYNMSF